LSIVNNLVDRAFVTRQDVLTALAGRLTLSLSKGEATSCFKSA
jgi:hypothetical protein